MDPYNLAGSGSVSNNADPDPVREAANKKSVFFSGRTTKRGGGKPPDH